MIVNVVCRTRQCTAALIGYEEAGATQQRPQQLLLIIANANVDFAWHSS